MLLPAIIIAGAALRLFQIGRESLWYDELYTVWASNLPLDVMFREVPASGHPLLYYLVAHVWNGFGSGGAWFRMVSCFAGVATIWLIYLLGKELISRRAGLWAAAFAAFSPYLIWYSRDATDYSWLMAVATLSLYYLVRSARRGGWANWSIYVLASAAALYSHYFAVILLAVEFFLFLLLMDSFRPQLKPWLTSQITLAILALPWALSNRNASGLAVWHLPSKSTLSALIMSPLTLTGGYVGKIGSGAAVFVAGRIEKLGFILLALYIGGLVIWSKPLRKALRGRLGLAVFFCTAMLITVPLLVLSQSPAGRYLALAAPFFILLIALVVCAAPRRMGAIAGGIILTGLFVFTISQFVWTHNDDWRGVVEEITNEGRPGESILCFPLHNCAMALEIYSTDHLPLLGGSITPWDDNYINLQTVAGWHGYLDGYGTAENFRAYTGTALKEALRQQLAGASGIWLVAGTGELGHYPPSDLIDQALNDDWKLMDSRDFDPLILKHYERRQG